MTKRSKFKKIWLLALCSPLLVTPVVLSSCAQSETTTSTYSKDDLYSSYSALGTSIESAMQNTQMNNNFGFFGGSDLANYSMYDNNGYRSYVDLFSDYFRYNGPYKLDDSTYGFDTTTKRRVIGSRYVFDFSSSNATLDTLLSSYSGLVNGNNIKTSVLVIDAADINNMGDTTYAQTFATNLRRFILTATNQNNNKGMVIIQKHYYTSDATFNSLVDQTNSVINSVVEGLSSYSDIFSRIGLVDASKNTNNDDFKTNGVNATTSLLTPTGTLELLNIFADSLYSNHTSISEWTSSSSDISDSVINHTITTNTASYLQTADSEATAFQTYLNSNTSLRWMFVGDSWTNGSYYTKGYNGIYDYFKWFLKNDLSRSSDTVVNMGVHSSTYPILYANENSGYNFLSYSPDVVHLWLGINDIYNEATATEITIQYFTNYLTQTLDNLAAVNSSAYLIVSTIPLPRNDTITSSISTAVANANIAIRNFANSNSLVILNDLASVVDSIIATDASYQSSIYASDLLHFQSTAYVAFTKNLLTAIGSSFTGTSLETF